MTDRLALGNPQSGRAHAGWQAVHAEFNLPVKTIAANGQHLEGDRCSGTEGEGLGERIAISIAQRHVHRPGGERKVGRGLPHDEAIHIAGIIARAAEEIAHLEAIGAVLFDLELAVHVR